MKRMIKCSDEKPMKFTEYLQKVNPTVYNRLAGCCSRKEDLPILVGTRWSWLKMKGKDKEGFTKEDALVQILEWLDSNGQWQLADITTDEYEDLKH